jgi:hypothetical protein
VERTRVVQSEGKHSASFRDDASLPYRVVVAKQGLTDARRREALSGKIQWRNRTGISPVSCFRRFGAQPVIFTGLQRQLKHNPHEWL